MSRESASSSRVSLPGAIPLLLGARTLRDFGDGFVAVLLPLYLVRLGFSSLAVGVLAALALLGSALLTLAVGVVGARSSGQTWIFDAHLLDAGWKQPRLCQVCPTDVFEAVKLDDEAMAERARRENLRPLRAELGARPRVWCRGLDRWETEFVGGSVAIDTKGRIDCAEGVEVVLLRNGVVVSQTKPDGFGDFRFDGLRAGDEGLAIEVRHHAGSIRRDVELTESRYLGEILVKS